ncbi:hypothetical protein MLD38_011228 [Melastoma candidum]|uniref:Uncharacterized protein n=1 Tax=Melastoma candidum TaxID=119954 RepID=A0ACB9R2E0_9MYRT|nr:hypothetical protein MLD38_011228 [Melastoma candidum]
MSSSTSSSSPSSSDPYLPALKLPRREGSGSKSGAMTVDDVESPRVDEDEEGCRTPTSEEHRIPSRTATCPPAPRKAVGRKRGRSEAEAEADSGTFKVGAPATVSVAEVEEFFRRMESARDRERVRVVVKDDGWRKKPVAIQLG